MDLVSASCGHIDNILFYGVEFTRAYRLNARLAVEPKPTAVRVREEILPSRQARGPSRVDRT